VAITAAGRGGARKPGALANRAVLMTVTLKKCVRLRSHDEQIKSVRGCQKNGGEVMILRKAGPVEKGCTREKLSG